MRVIVQKVINSSCEVDNKIINEINKGLMVLVGFTNTDSIKEIEWMAKKIANLRIFEDNNNIMNLSVIDIGGSILSISQFTLYADATKGNRPSYIKALNSEEAIKLYNLFNKELNKYVTTKEGLFGADMKINLINDGPTTIILEK